MTPLPGTRRSCRATARRCFHLWALAKVGARGYQGCGPQYPRPIARSTGHERSMTAIRPGDVRDRFPGDMDLAAAPGVLRDPPVHAHRAPASRYPALKRWLLQSSAGFQDIPAALSTPQEPWSDVESGPIKRLRCPRGSWASPWRRRSPYWQRQDPWLSPPCTEPG